MKNLLLYISVFFFLTSCFSVNQSKNKELLLKRIAEITEEKFEILSFSGNANEGDFDFSKYKATLAWEEDSNVKFNIEFKIKNDVVNLTDEVFENYFDRAKNAVDASYSLIALGKEKFSSFKLSCVNYNETEYTIHVFIEKELNDNNYQETIVDIRWFAVNAFPKINCSKLRLMLNFVRNINDIPNSPTTPQLYMIHENGNGFMYSSVTFKYNGRFFIENEEVKLASDNLSFNSIESYTRDELHPAIIAALQKRHEDKKIAVSKINFLNNLENLSDASLNENIDWQVFSARVSDLINNQELEKVTGQVNIYSNEVKIDN